MNPLALNNEKIELRKRPYFFMFEFYFFNRLCND